jgi:uncharacterized protein
MYFNRMIDTERQDLKFIADENVGKLAKRLRLLGFDTLFFKGEDDGNMIQTALAEKRIVITRDTRILERKPVAGGKVKTLLIQTDNVDEQTAWILNELDLIEYAHPFTLCIECNAPLVRISRSQAKERVPPYVWQNHDEFVECRSCRRVYWKGTHWAAMRRLLRQIKIIDREDPYEKEE